jgi:hypothetical protein
MFDPRSSNALTFLGAENAEYVKPGQEDMELICVDPRIELTGSAR